ncbi:hypothetical protein [Sphingomonas sp. SRS2]|uniref:hypothetical protein n=1 Tax=Sphingomonas sp. SRS2 TaxID=133190 RepID=UPI00069763C9|nr:hypothetical protein [Sphingomonas sp. SRS2]
MGRPSLPFTGATSDGHLVTMREGDVPILTQLAGWDRFEEVADALLHPFSLSVPRDYRRPIRRDMDSIWRTAPDRALILSAKPLGLESSGDIAVLDLSHARRRLIVEGPGAGDLLSRVMALDFSEQAFPVGSFAQGSLHHVGVLVDRHAADRFDLLVPTTWAKSLIDLMADHLRRAS